MTKEKTQISNRITVKHITHLNSLIDKKHYNYFIILAGGLVISRKTIKKKKDKHGFYKFHITNHIDDTTQLLSNEELCNINKTNIGEAILKSSLICEYN